METFKIDNEQELILDNGQWVLHKNGVPLNGIPKSIYKYYSLHDYNIDALEKCYFYLTNPKDFNDPFDCSRNLIMEQQKEFIDGLPIPALNNKINKGICCFSTNGLNPLMWGHYTDSYNGFVVEYDIDLKIVSVPEMKSEKLMRVIYSDNPNPVSEKSPFANMYQLVVKLAPWEYENEWRLIVDKQDTSMMKVHFDPKAIKSFSFGYKAPMSGKLMNLIREKYPDVSKFIVGPDATKLKLKKIRLLEGKAGDLKNIKLVLK